jgi:hypothetical protein
MTKFLDTAEGKAFIASAASRQTSPEIMETIAFFARDLAEAEALWDGAGIGRYASMLDIWERVTSNGLHDPSDFHWGAAGSGWYTES